MSLWRRQSGLWTMVVQGIEVLLQTTIALLSIRLLSTEAWATIAFALHATGTLAVLLFFGSSEIAVLLLAAQKTTTAAVLHSLKRQLRRGSGWVLGLSALTALTVVDGWQGRCAILLLCCTLIANGVSSLWHMPLLAHEKAGVGVVSLTTVRLAQCVGVGVVASLPAAGHVVGLGIVHLVGAAALAVKRRRLAKRFAWSDQGSDVPPDLSRGRSLGISSIFGQMSNRSDGWVLQALASPQDVGGYFAMARVFQGLNAVSTALALAVFPKLAVQGRKAERLTLFSVLLFGVAALGARSSAAHWAVGLFGTAYADFVSTVEWLLLAGACQAVAAVGAKMMVVWRQERRWLSLQTLSMVANVVGNLALVPGHGAEGAAMATALSQALLAVVFLPTWLVGKGMST